MKLPLLSKKNFSFLALVLPLLAFSQYVLPNEEVIYSFETSKNKKMVLVKDKDNGYIQYRYGTPTKVELSFPKERTLESWNLFKYNTYNKTTNQNIEDIEIDNISFVNKQHEYLIYRTNFANGEEGSTGIIVKKKGKGARIDGLLTSVNGSLSRLDETTQLKKEHIRLRF